jgi:hypothetical protein
MQAKIGKYVGGRIAPKVLLPVRGGEGRGKDTLCQNQLLPWQNGQNDESYDTERDSGEVAAAISECRAEA